jgi:hypothetical protein
MPDDKSVVVLSVPHQLQGRQFRDYVEDPCYPTLLKELLFGVEFVFEEAAGCGPSIAEKLVRDGYAGGHYLDIDPRADQREKYGMAPITIDPGHSTSWYNCQMVDEHRKREKFWLEQVKSEQFQKALVICGLHHGLSFAFRLEAAGFPDVELYDYVPFHKLGAKSSAP